MSPKYEYCRRCNNHMKDGLHYRYYCPKCHEVACGMKRQGVWIVVPHYRSEDHSRVATRPCIGGAVDEKRDRAP